MVHSTAMKVSADSEAVRHADRKIDRRIGCDPQILGEPAFRILMIAADQIELIIAAVLQPFVENVVD